MSHVPISLPSNGELSIAAFHSPGAIASKNTFGRAMKAKLQAALCSKGRANFDRPLPLSTVAKFCTLEHWATVKAEVRKKQAKADYNWKRLYPMQYAAVPTGLSGNPRCYHSCEYIEDSVFFIGGLNHLQQLHDGFIQVVNVTSKKSLTFSTSSQIDLKVGERKVLDDGIVPVFGHTSARVGSRIFVFGGRTAVKPMLEYSYPHYTPYDIRAGEASVPIERRHRELGFGAETAQLLHYTDNKWCVEEAANSPCPRAFHSMLSVGKLLFVFGGVTSKASLARGRVGQHTKFKVGDQCVVALLDLHVFDTSTRTWQIVTTAPLPTTLLPWSAQLFCVSASETAIPEGVSGVQNMNKDLTPVGGHDKDGEDSTWYCIGLLATEHFNTSWNTMYMLCVPAAKVSSDNKSASASAGDANASHLLTWMRRNFDPGVGHGFEGTYEGCFRMTEPTALADYSVCTTSGGRFLFGLGGIVVNRQHRDAVFPFAPMRVTKDSTFFLGSGFFVDLGARNCRLTQMNVHPEYESTRLPLAVVRPALCCHPEGIITTQGVGAHWVFHEDHTERPLRGSGSWNLLQHEAMFTDVCFLQLQESAFERMTQLSFARGQTCKVVINKKKFEGIVLRKLHSGKYAVKLASDCFPSDFKMKSGVATFDASDIFPSQLVSKPSFFLDGPSKFGCALDPFAVQKVTANDISALGPSSDPAHTMKETYSCIAKVGQGAFSQVFCAKHLSSKTLKAVKILRRAREKTEKEYKILQALSAGPNIIRCFEFLEEPESLTCILVFEWVNIVSPQVLTTLQLRQDFLLQLLEAVQYCHQDAPRKVVHRDIKPGNILLQQTAPGKIEAKLADWGLAVFVDQIESYFGPAGTPGYKCPHLHMGCLLGVRSVRDGFPLDMWSVGCVALEVLSGSEEALFKPTSQQLEAVRAAQQTQNGGVDSLGPSAFRASVDAYTIANYTKILGMRDFLAMFHPELFTYLCSEVATVLEAVGNCAAFIQLVPGPKAKDKLSLHVFKKISVAEPMAQQCCESLYAALHKAKEYDLVSYTHNNNASAARETHGAGILRFRSAQTTAALHILLGLQGSELVAVAESFFLILRRELLCHHWRAAQLQYVHANTAGVCEVARMRLNKQLICAKRDGVGDTKGHTQLQLPLKRVADIITPDIKAIFTRGRSDSQSNAESGVKAKGDVETRHNHHEVRHVVADVTALLMKLRVKQYEMKLRDCTRDATEAIDRVHNPSVEDRVAAPLAASATDLEPARARWRGTGSATKRNSRHALPAIFQLKQQCNLAAKHFSQHKSKKKNAKRGRYSRGRGRGRGRKKLSTVSRRDNFSTRHARSSAPTSIPVMNEVDDLDSDGCDSARASDSHVVAVDVHGDLAYLAGPSEPEKGGVINSVLAWFGGGRDSSGGGGGGSDLIVRKVGGYFDQLIFKWNRAMDTFNRLRNCLNEVTMGEAEREGETAAAADSKVDTRLGSKVDANADVWSDDAGSPGMHVPPTLPAHNVYVVKARRCLTMIEQRAKATITMAIKCLTKAAKFHQKLESIHVQKVMQWPPPRTTPTKYPDFHYCYEGDNHVQKGASAVARRREAEPRSKHHLIAHRLPTELPKWMREQGCPYDSQLHTIAGLSSPHALDFVRKLLRWDLSSRLTVGQALKHPFMQNKD